MYVSDREVETKQDKTKHDKTHAKHKIYFILFQTQYIAVKEIKWVRKKKKELRHKQSKYLEEDTESKSATYLSSIAEVLSIVCISTASSLYRYYYY